MPEGTIHLPGGVVRYPDYSGDEDEAAEREAAALMRQREQNTADGTPIVQKQSDRPRKRI